MWRPEGADHDGLWVLQVRVQRLAEAVLSYAVWPLDGDGRPAFTRRPEPDGRFRGAAAPPPPPTNDPVLGRLEDHLVDSAALGGRRAVTVYLPPNHDAAAGPYPVVYATDGQFFAPYARRVDAAIAAGRVRPLVVVAAHAASFDPAQGGNLRALEYLLGFDARRYAAHERFFVEELSAWAEARFGVAADREARAVFGCSDGGGHALTTGVFHAGRFGHVLAYSAGTPPVGSEHWESTAPPRIQLCAGTLEPAFYGATAAWSLYLSRLGVAHEFTEAVSGHELLQWVEELPASLARAFPT
jgi:enterochelin esterase-like enzyme